MGAKLIIPNADFSANAVTTPFTVLNNKTESKIAVNGQMISDTGTSHGGAYWGRHVNYENSIQLDCKSGDNYYENNIKTLIRPFAGSNFDGEILTIDLTDLTVLSGLGEMFNDKSLSTPLNNTIKKIVFTGTPQNDIALYSPFSGLQALEEIVGLDKLFSANITFPLNGSARVLDAFFYNCKKLKTIDLRNLVIEEGKSINGQSFLCNSEVNADIYLPKGVIFDYGFDFFVSKGVNLIDGSDAVLSVSSMPSVQSFVARTIIFKSIKLSEVSSSKAIFSNKTKTLQAIDYASSDIDTIKAQLEHDWGSGNVSYDEAGTFTNNAIE